MDSIRFEPTGKWHGFVHFPQAIQKTTTIKELLALMAKLIQRIQKEYNSYMGNDGVLVGQEKANLIRSMYGILSILIHFRILLLPRGTKEIEVHDINRAFHWKMTFFQDAWKGTGQLKTIPAHPIPTFRNLFQDQIKKQAEALIHLYAQSIEDSNLDTREVELLNFGLDQSIYLSLAMIYSLKTGSMRQ